MFIIGSEQLFNETIYICNNQEEIAKKENKNIIIKDIKLAKFCHEKKINYFAICNNIIDMMYFSSLQAKYIVSENLDFAKTMQDVANEYLLDSKIALIIHKKEDIIKAISKKIDGVIFNTSII